MRRYVPMLLILLATDLRVAQAQDSQKPTEPTSKQLAAAKKAYAKFGATYRASTDPHINQTTHTFWMPRATNARLKNLPDLPFRFELNLSYTQVTSAGPPGRSSSFVVAKLKACS